MHTVAPSRELGVTSFTKACTSICSATHNRDIMLVSGTLVRMHLHGSTFSRARASRRVPSGACVFVWVPSHLHKCLHTVVEARPVTLIVFRLTHLPFSPSSTTLALRIFFKISHSPPCHAWPNSWTACYAERYEPHCVGHPSLRDWY